MFFLKKQSFFFFKGLQIQSLLFKKGLLVFFDFFFFKSNLVVDLRYFAQQFGFSLVFLNTKFLSFFFRFFFFFF